MEESTTELHQILREQCIETKRELKVLHGIDGFSPIANVERVEDGAKITITDKTGTTEATVLDGPVGPRGPQGEPGPAAAWGEITGDIDNQGDLKAKLDGINTTISDFRDEYDGFTEEISTAIETEIEAREDADAGLQEQIDGITASSDVKDIVGTKAELDAYDKTTLGNNDIIKVISDSTHDDAMAYYRFDKATDAFIYIGKEGPFYTKSEADEKFVKPTDYATTSKGGTLRLGVNGVTGANGYLSAHGYTFQEYETKPNATFIGKLTLDNLLAGRKYLMPEYVQELPAVGEENKLYLVPAEEQPDTLTGAEGKDITITDASQGDLEWGAIKGETSQETTTGKNLAIPLKEAGEQTVVQGVTFTQNADGSVTANGTASGSAYYSLGLPDNISAGRYIISGGRNGTGTTHFVEVRYKANESASWQYPKSTTITSNGVMNLDETGQVGSMYIAVNAGNTVDNVTFYPMLEKSNDPANTERTFEPYTAGASPNPDYPQEVKTVAGRNEIAVTGKNTADPDFIFGELGTFYNVEETTYNNQPCHKITRRSSSVFRFDLENKTGTTISLDIANPSGDYYIYVHYEDGTHKELSKRVTSSEFTNVKLEGTKRIIELQFELYGWSNTMYIKNLMIEDSPTKTTFEPYRRDIAEVNLNGKNLLPMQFTNGSASGLTWTIEPDGTIVLNGTTTSHVHIQKNVKVNLEAGKTYTMSGTGLDNIGNAGLKTSGEVDVYIISPTYPTRTFTATDDKINSIAMYDVYIRPSTTFTNQRLQVQLEEGDTSSDYSPYFTPIELLKIGTHQDRIYKDVDGWKLHKEIGKDTIGGKTWESASSISAFFTYTSFGSRPDTAQIYAISEAFRGISRSSAGTSTDNYMCINADGYLIIRHSESSSPSDFKTWADANNSSYYYVLPTPTDTLITNEALIEQLEALNTLATGKGYNLITTETENEKPTLQFSYYHPDPTVTKDEFLWILNHYEQLGGHRRFTHNLSVNHHTAQGHWQYSFQLTTDTHEHFTHLYQIAKYISDNHSGLVLPVSGTYTEGDDTYIITKLEGYSANQVAIEMRKISDASLRRITTGAVDVQDFIS